MKTRRIVAFIIDIISISLFSYLVYHVLWLSNIKITSQVVYCLVFVMVICKDCLNGVSLGKRVIGIQVIDSKVLKIASPKKCIIRNLFYCLWIVEFLVLVCNSTGLRIGDLVTNTKVVERNKILQNIQVSKVIIAVGIVVAFVILLNIIICFRAHALGVTGFFLE